MSQLDLATSSGVLAFLADTPFSSDIAIKLTGGYGNYVFRLHLKEPFEGRQTLVLKHGKPHLPGDESFKFSVERQVNDRPCQ